MIINIEDGLFNFEQALIELRYAAYDEPDLYVRATLLALVVAIETILKVADVGA